MIQPLPSRYLLPLLLTALLFGVGCHISDYPVITDDRGDYSGVIRTGHKAYIRTTGVGATTWADGSDETFTMVYQNQYGDQKLYTFNNYDPTGSVVFLDQTYCDWTYEGCPIFISWNPVQNDDDTDDYEHYDDSCLGARSICWWIEVPDRQGECGDGLFTGDPRAFFREFSQLQTTSWRGERAYVLPLDSQHMDVTLVSQEGSRWSAPLLGSTSAIVTDRLQVVVPMTPNTRHTIRWAKQWVADHGARTTAEIRYGGVSAQIKMTLRPEGLAHNSQRF